MNNILNLLWLRGGRIRVLVIGHKAVVRCLFWVEGLGVYLG
jgi:hypothetical protein